jgi:hypothetical protein
MKRQRPPSARIQGTKNHHYFETNHNLKKDNSAVHSNSFIEKENAYKGRSGIPQKKQIVPIAITTIHSSTKNLRTQSVGK